METAKAIVLLLIGFIVLIKSSDFFVDAISSIATNFKMSKMMIALTVAAFGTCAPELAISLQSISSNAGDIALSNVLGSNVVNILLIVGLTALIHPIKVKIDVTKKELPILVVVTSLFTLSLLLHYFGVYDPGFILNRQDGFMFIGLFILFMLYIVSVIRTKQGVFEHETPKYNLFLSILITIICCTLIVFSSDLVVENAKIFATNIGVSTKLITMTFVVIGTSLPEMTMTVIAAKKEEFDIALGNIIGTNIFNIGVVLGLPLMIYGGFSSTSFNLIDIFAVPVAALSLFIFAKNDKLLSKKEGAVMLILFVMYYTYLFIV